MRFLLFLFLTGCATQPLVGQLDGPHGRLRAFASDGCTGSLDGSQERPDAWKHCCEEHDLKYWAGGTKEARLAADQELEACVAASGHGDSAKLMYLAVRIFGNPYNETPWRWGFGWTKLRGYSALSESERREIELHLPEQVSERVRALVPSEPGAACQVAAGGGPAPDCKL